MAKKTMKLSQLSKDFAMKSKDVLDAFKDLGMEKKSGANADDVEFALFFQKVTKANQIENLDDYVKGVAKIRAEKPAVEEKPAEDRGGIRKERRKGFREGRAEARGKGRGKACGEGGSEARSEGRRKACTQGRASKTRLPDAPPPR